MGKKNQHSIGNLSGTRPTVPTLPTHESLYTIPYLIKLHQGRRNMRSPECSYFIIIYNHKNSSNASLCVAY